MQEVALRQDAIMKGAGEGKSKASIRTVTYGYHMVEGKMVHAMEDYVVACFKEVDGHELGLFAVFDGHSGQDVASYLRQNLFSNILIEPDFWTETEKAIRRAYLRTDWKILEKAEDVRQRGGSTAVTVILIDGEKLVVANVGDSRAIVCEDGIARQLSVDHEPEKEQNKIERRGGFLTHKPGNVPRVDGQLAMSRAFGDRQLKAHINSDPDIVSEIMDSDAEFLILASDGLWKVMTNQEAVDAIKYQADAQTAAKELIEEALSRRSKDDISCIVVRFQGTHKRRKEDTEEDADEEL